MNDTRAERTKEIREANRLLVEQRDELARTNDELIELQQLKEDLTNMVVHDLKGPLTEIQANLEMMRAEPLTEFMSELVESAETGSHDLVRMLTNLLDVSRLEENRMILELEPFDASGVIRRVLDRFKPLSNLKMVTISMELPEDLPQVVADRALFERILNNLVSNALDYTPEDGKIVVMAEYQPIGFRFEVKDTGCGIPKELHEKIFEKFSQGKRGRPKTGSGLGLTFCRMAIEAQGGHIRVESEPGQGSSFIFTIPPISASRDERGLSWPT
ncbi:MAG: HAMP domain-containing histidine kinase [Deltaproteobacteria bacterium]|nr:HAMP domain-containing histidine kinase [Deltaproteobacteria bacterium]